MFLRCHERKKDGKLHHYWSIVESRRVSGGPPVQRQVLYLGEISDSQEAAWRKSIEVFDEEKERPGQFCLFSSDKVIADDEANALSLVLSEMRLLRARSFGDCWLGCLLWDELGLGAFWDDKLASDRGRAVVEGAAGPGGQPPVRSDERVRGASPRVPGQRDG